ncbi:MAG: YdcF family protein, partial [Taibaiella sp.]|nr:YdcF family protein [Taibaiella sp.]
MKSAENILIVLGYPADNDGNPGPILKARLDKAIELYRNGVARKIIVTGAAVDNEFVESEVMAVYLVHNGIPH